VNSNENVLNYFKPDDWQIRAFKDICKEFCEFKIDKEKQTITFILDTPEKEAKYKHAFEHFNWND
jgi:hypothetical protein